MQKVLYTFLLVSLVGLLVFPSKAVACISMESHQAKNCCAVSESENHSCEHNQQTNKKSHDCPDASCVCTAMRVNTAVTPNTFLLVSHLHLFEQNHQFFYKENTPAFVYYTIWTPPKIG